MSTRKKSPRRSKKFAFTREISVVPTVIAIAGLLWSFWAFYDQKSYNEKGRLSWIGVRVDQYWEPKVKITSGPDNYDPYIYRKKTKLTFSNNGYTRASIVSWGFYVPTEIEKDGKSRTVRIWVPGLEPKLKNLKNENIALPINLDAGESAAVVLEYSVGIPAKAYLALPSKIKSNQAVDWREIDRNLRSVYGESDPIEYLAEFVRSDGESIAVRFSNYGTNGFMQGERRPGMAEYVR